MKRARTQYAGDASAVVMDSAVRGQGARDETRFTPYINNSQLEDERLHNYKQYYNHYLNVMCHRKG